MLLVKFAYDVGERDADVGKKSRVPLPSSGSETDC
jgi:hypothetical protein